MTGVNTALAGTIAGTDSVLGGFGKTQKQLTDIASGVTANQWTAATGDVYRASGNVGIGTAAPGTKLHVADSSNGLASFINSTLSSVLIQTKTNGGADSFGGIDFTNDNYPTKPIARIATDSTAGGSKLVFGTSNSYASGITNQAMSIDSSGNVGVGTVTPSSLFEVVGANSTADLRLTRSNNVGAASEMGTITFRAPNASGTVFTWAQERVIVENATAGTEKASLAFNTQNSGSLVERMRIDSSGNVGIGTMAPTATLHLKAGAAAVNKAPLKFTSGVNLTTPEAGAIEYDGTNLYYTDNTNTRKTLGVTGAGITTLGGLSGTSQTFATGTAGTAPAFSSATTIHTLNIPMAATAAVTAGLISKADYDAFSAKQAAFTTSAGLLGILTDEIGSGSAVFSVSPTFTGVPLAPTAAVDTNTTQIATTAFVLGQASAVAPLMNGVAAVGTSLRYTRQDHIHPTDTSRAPAAGSTSITTLGTVTTGTWNAGVIGVPYGGTGKATLGLNKLLYGNGTAAVNELALPASLTTTSVLLSSITTGEPAWNTSTTGNVLKGSVTGVAFGPLASSDLPAGTLSGSGTAGYIPYYSAATTLANSPMAVSGSKVGIGTLAPGSKLHLTDALPVLLTVERNSNQNALIEYKNTLGSMFAGLISGTSNFGIGTTDDLSTGSKLVVSNSGNIGIGTTAPANALAVHSAEKQIRIQDTDDATGVWSIGTVGADNRNLNFMDDNTNIRMTIHEAGNVGIGIVAPVSPLHNHVASASSNYHFFTNTTTGATVTDGTYVGTSSTGNSYLMNNEAQSLIFGTSAAEKMRIDSAGNVGIGTVSPAVKLDVSGQGNFVTTAAVVLKVTGLGVGYADATNGVASIYSENSAGSGGNVLKVGSAFAPLGLIVKDTGSVGIATTTPSEKLEVVGNIKATAYLYTSDKRLKKNIETIDDSLDKILRLRGVEFDWKKSGAHEIGLIAQEVEEVEPELVETSSVDGMKSVKYGNIVAILIEAMKVEHQQVEENKKLISLMSNGLEKVDHRVRKMEREIASLKDENKKLKDDIQSIKKYLKIK